MTLYKVRVRMCTLNSAKALAIASVCKPGIYKKLPYRKMVVSRMLRRVALIRTDVSEELNASFIRVTRIGKLGTTLAVTSNRLGISSQSASVDR
jgi:hypothetical protein